MHTLFNEMIIHDAVAAGDMVQVKPYLDSTGSGISYEGEHSGKIGIIAACPVEGENGSRSDKVVVQVQHDDGTLETFTCDINGLVLLERRAQDRV